MYYPDSTNPDELIQGLISLLFYILLFLCLVHKGGNLAIPHQRWWGGASTPAAQTKAAALDMPMPGIPELIEACGLREPCLGS